jgi:hypothetical protein
MLTFVENVLNLAIVKAFSRANSNYIKLASRALMLLEQKHDE